MQVIRKTLIDVIAWDTQARFIIPRWQRHYVWGDKEILQMWSDWEHDCARNLAAARKAELSVLRKRFAPLLGDRQAILTIGSESISLSVKVTMDKSGKIKIAAAI